MLALTLPIVAGDRAEAACTADTPPLADDGSVTCDGNDSTGFDASAAINVTIVTSGETELNESDAGLDSAILVSNGSTVTLGEPVPAPPDAPPPTVTVTVGDANGFGVQGGNDNTITNHGTILINATNGTGLGGGDTNLITNEVDGVITIDAAATGGVGLRGNDNNFATNNGTITVDADDGRAISIGNNTSGILPNGAVGGLDSQITLRGTDTIGILAGENAGIANSGIILVEGDGSRGIVANSRTDNRIGANLTHQDRSITITGDNAVGFQAGDDWLDGTFEDLDGNALTPREFVPSAAGIRFFEGNTGPMDDLGGMIEVLGANSTGLMAGEDSFIVSNGTIRVEGMDSVGVSLGGNTFQGRLDFDAADNSGELFSFDNLGSGSSSITGGPDAGPLIRFDDFVVGQENRVINRTNGEILADLTNGMDPNRGIAIEGTDGDELIFNQGDIRGHLELGGGDDRYIQTGTGSYEGQIRAGAGDDLAVLSTNSFSAVPIFDISQLEDFETLELVGAGAWQLENADSFTGATDVQAGVILQVPTPLTLGGDLTFDPDAGTRLTLVNGATTPLTVGGDATFDGALTVIRDDSLRTPGDYRLIQVVGTSDGVFATENFPSSSGLFTFETTYDANGLLVTLDLGTFSSVAQGANSRAIGAHLDAILADGTGDAELDAQILELAGGSGDLNKVFNALSPEGLDAQTSMVVESGRRITSLLLDRPRECDPEQLDPWRGSNDPLPCHARGWSPWVAAIGSFRSRDGFTGRPRYDAKLGGAAFGIDVRPLGGLDLTVAVSSQRGKINVASQGESTLTMTDLSAHAAYTAGLLRVQSAFTWGHTFHKSRRLIRFNESATPVNVSAKDDFESDRFTLAGEIGLLFSLGPINIEPVAGVDWNWVEQDDVRESSAGVYGLAVESRDDEVGSVNGGLRLSSVYHQNKYLARQLNWADGVWRPSIDVRWRQMVEGDNRTLRARLLGSPDTVAAFSVDGKEDKGGIEIGAGLSFVPERANRLQFDVRYEAYRASHTVDHELLGRVSFGF